MSPHHYPTPAELQQLGPPAQAFIGFIIAAISAIAGWLGAAGGAIATASLTVINWLTSSVGWLARRFVNIVSSSGAMFSKLWQASKSVWFDVVRPALAHLARWIGELRDWLKAKLAPVFRLLARVHDRILNIYRRFVRPVLDLIEQTRGVLQILITLHVPFARALDRYLAEAEQVITENYLKLLAYVNHVTDVLSSIVTGDLLFQRVPFLASLKRDAPHWIAMWWNAQMTPLTPEQRTPATAQKLPRVDPALLSKELAAYYQDGSGALAPLLNELVPLWDVAKSGGSGA